MADSPSRRKTPYITRPDAHLAEGEIEVTETGVDADEQVLAFATALLRAALDDGSGTDSLPSLSSLSLERLGPVRGRIYGQAYLERPGTTIHFLRVRLLDEQGEPVLTGMATSHVSRP